MSYRRLTTGLLVWLVLNVFSACQTRPTPTEQPINMPPDTTVFDDDTLEGAIRDTVRQSTKHKN